jgi:tetratricopeptide (TPR) repeat protein
MRGQKVEHAEVVGLPSGSIADVAARLLLWSRRSGKGLAQVEYSSEFSRQRVVERVEAELGGTAVQTIALLRQRSAADAVQDLCDQLAQVPDGAVVWVTGFASAFEQVDGLRALNFNRETLAAFPVRQVWWVTPVVGQMLLQATPDLQGWFNPKLRLTESIAVVHDGLIQERSGSRVALADALERSRKLVQQFEQVRQTDISDQEALKTYLLPGLEALAEVGAEQQLHDLTLQFEGFLGGIKDGDQLDVADSLNRLGMLYYKQGRYRHAEPLLKQALGIREQQLGQDHSHTAVSLNNLAALYESVGRYVEAEPLYLEALAISKDQLGDRHASTMKILGNLAGLYHSMARYESAEPLYLEALEISKDQLGDRHPDTATILNRLALLYESMGRYAAAEPLCLEALAIKKEQLGDRHPSTGASLNNLALLYESMNRYAAAEPLFREALAIARDQLGDRHPSTATSLNNLALFYHNMKQFDRALPLLEEALSIRQEVLPAEHPDILSTQESLVNLREMIGGEIEN